jgi:predicted transcriptional regulator
LEDPDLTSIPDFLLERIDELGHFELLEPDAEYLAETPKILLENMLASKEIMTFGYSKPSEFSALHFRSQAPRAHTQIHIRTSFLQ